MYNKKVNLIVSILCIFVIFLIAFAPYSQADSMTGEKLWDDGVQFIKDGKDGKSVINQGNVTNAFIPIGRTLVMIATIVLTVVTVVMGIKYMMCDSADKKAKLKTQLIGLVISVIVVYGAQIIWSILLEFMTDVTGE